MKLSLGEGHGEGNVSMEHHDMGGHHDNMSLNMGHGSDGHGDSSHGIGHAVVEMAGHAMKSMLGGHAPSGHEEGGGGGHGHHDGKPEVHLVDVEHGYENVGALLLCLVAIIIATVIKIGFHHTHVVSSRVPESCMLIILGIIFGAIIEYGDIGVIPKFDAEMFFHYLLPPIILEAAYSLHHPAFLDNIRIILLFALVGTAFNFLLIGALLVGVNEAGWMQADNMQAVVYMNETYNHNLTAVEIFTFSSLISAVDPVAVLAIFQEVHVNSELYFIVFGESLLNDGVAVVFYNIMNSFAAIENSGYTVTVIDCLLGCASFFTVAGGGCLLGLIVGLMTGIITRATTGLTIIEPLIVMGMGYIAYFLAELMHWSGILSMVCCGVVQAHYAFKNIHRDSLITIDTFSKTLSQTMDTVIFLYIGKSILGLEKSWSWNVHIGFVAWNIVFCLIIRFMVIYSFTFILNRYRLKPINLQEQFIMAYGGLRGAVGFALVLSIDPEIVPSSAMFVSTTLITVLFTIFFQGSTIKPLVTLLNIDRENSEQKKLMEELNDYVIDNIYAGINRVMGSHSFGVWQNIFFRFDEQYLMKIFCKDNMDNKMKKLFEEIEIQEHLKRLYDPKSQIKKATSFINDGFESDQVSLRSIRPGLSLPDSPMILDKKIMNLIHDLHPSRSRRGSERSNITRRSVRLSVIDPQTVATGRDDLSVLRSGLNISSLADRAPGTNLQRRISTISHVSDVELDNLRRRFSTASYMERNKNLEDLNEAP